MFRFIGRFFAAVLGEIHWRPPVWFGPFARHKIASLLLLALALFGGNVGWQKYQAWKNRPQPDLVTIKTQPIPISPFSKDRPIIPPNLIVNFSGPTAPLDAIRKTVPKGIHIDPSVEGAWRWDSDRQLSFKPLAEWPANTRYTISFDRDAIANSTKMASFKTTAETPPFTVRIRDFSFYQDPQEPAVKQVVATLDFSHPVELGALEKQLALGLVGRKDKQAYTVTYGPHNRIAYVRSTTLKLPDQQDFMKLVVPESIRTSLGGAKLDKPADKQVPIPDRFSFFKISKTTGTTALDKNGEPDQILVIESTAEARSEEVFKNAELWLLPAKKVEEEQSGESDEEAPSQKRWKSPAEITPEILAKAQKIPLELVPSFHEHSKIHTFKFRKDVTGDLFFKIAKGVKAPGDFTLGDDYTQVLPVPAPGASIEIQGDGGVLALGGEKKISVRSRGFEALRYQICRVRSDQINHLVTQTEGTFQEPTWENSDYFNEENISRIGYDTQRVGATGRMKLNYTSFDFTPQLAQPKDGGPGHGLFLVNIRGWDPAKNSTVGDTSTGQFLLVTDLGIIAKTCADGSREVFLQSLSTGQPVANATVELLGKNGLPLASATSDPDGHLTLPSQINNEREKRPVALVARSGEDLAFLPVGREDRLLDFSRFDTGGEMYQSGAELEAFAFTERGIYRPGDDIHAGFIVKRRDWQGDLAGLPVEAEVLDAKGQPVFVRKLSVPASGFMEMTCPTQYESASGIYRIQLFLLRKGKRSDVIASTSVHVKEFLPDRMKIASSLNRPDKGWHAPEGISASVELRNLYGSPAENRTIRSRVELDPTSFGFKEYPGYTFYDRLRDNRRETRFEKISFDDRQTDEEGKAQIDFDLDRFGNATYSLTYFVEGFEPGSGRSVATSNTLLISPLPHLVGYKTDANLSFLPSGQAAVISLVAINPALDKIALDHATLRLTEVRYVSVLTKQDNGNYAYESVRRTQPVSEQPIAIPAEGFKYQVPTKEPGQFLAELTDESGLRLCRFEFTVVGKGAVTRPLEKNAELSLKLNKTDVAGGEEIELAITAPYTGAGLITIERDRVYAHRWFQANDPSSIQKIRVPEDFEGSGYVNVAFVRGLHSKEIFMSPLSYAAAPFTANKGKRKLDVTLSTPDKARPGEPFHIKYKTDRPSKIAVFAVDQGILQVTSFEPPDPLAYFFRKSALTVATSQIVDLLMPEFSLLRAMAAPGGGEGAVAKNLNPFKRATEKPVVFWSGIIDAGPEERDVVYDVPDYFSGTLTVMAVAQAPTASGSAHRDSIVRGPYVLTPSAPVHAAPGDTFDVAVAIGAEKAGNVTVTAEPSEGLEVLEKPTAPVAAEAGREYEVAFKVRAKEKLGSASLLFRAKGNDDESHLRSTLSIRPVSPFATRVLSGNYRKNEFRAPVAFDLYPEYRNLEASASVSPFGLAHGLQRYLAEYPHGCSEQITSGAFCRLALAGETDFGIDRAEAGRQIEKTFQTLRGRQNDKGAFGFWQPEDSGGIDFLSVYVTHFLAEAKAAGFPPPEDMFARALRNLQGMIGREPKNLDDARTMAYAIYILTRQGVVTTNPILSLRDYLEKQKGWQNDLTAVYLAGSLALLQKQPEAAKMIHDYVPADPKHARFGDFWQPLSSDAEYISILSRHFPDMLKKMKPETFAAAFEPIGKQGFNTLSAAYSVLALKAYATQFASNAESLGISEVGRDKKASPLSLTGTAIKRGPFSPGTQELRFTSKAGPLGTFYQILASGFDRALPTKPEKNGLEVWRTIPDTVILGKPVRVTTRIRNLTKRPLTNVAVVDLLPGGFEIVNSSLQPGPGSAGCDFVEVREDRAVFFLSLGTGTREISYQIKATNRGQFIVPPTFAEAMYERGINGRGVASKVTADNPK